MKSRIQNLNEERESYEEKTKKEWSESKKNQKNPTPRQQKT